MRRRVRHTFSAGGIVLRHAHFGHDIVLVRRLAHELWALPKGTPIGAETPSETALREVREETGLAVQIDRFAGSIHYEFTRDTVLFRKTVNFYLMHAIGGDFADHDREYDLAEWVPTERALEKMTYGSEASLLRHILSMPAMLSHGQGQGQQVQGAAIPPQQTPLSTRRDNTGERAG